MPGANILPWPLVIGLGVLVGFAAAWVARLYLGSILGIAAGLLAGLLVIRGIFGYGRDRYAQALFLQMPDMIESIVSTTRAGLPVSEAFRIIAKDMRAPTGEEFARVNAELAIGGSIDTALLNMAERTGVPEYAIFAVAIGIQSRSGGRLSEICQNLAETIRQRVAIASRARALASESKATAIILVALPMLTGVGLSLMQPDYLQPLFADPRGQKMLLTGVGLMITGILAIRWMINWSVTD
jgi:tight adherence protein B